MIAISHVERKLTPAEFIISTVSKKGPHVPSDAQVLRALSLDAQRHRYCSRFAEMHVAPLDCMPLC